MLNQIKTALLLASLTAILLLIGVLLGGQSGLIIAFGLALAMNFFSYWYSDKIVLKLYRAQPAEVSKYPRLHQIVNEIARASKIPKPKIYIVPTETPNAFATGRNQKHAAIAVTKGICDLLSEDELKGVLSHEAAHIKNKDILISTVAATIAGAISFLAIMARWAAIFGGFGGRGRDRGIAELLILAIVAPLIALVIRLAISRSREYLADESGAKAIHKPLALAAALEKLEKGAKAHPFKFGNESTSHMFIINPFSKSFFLNLLSTHPPVKERIARLKHLKV